MSIPPTTSIIPENTTGYTNNSGTKTSTVHNTKSTMAFQDIHKTQVQAKDPSAHLKKLKQLKEASKVSDKDRRQAQLKKYKEKDKNVIQDDESFYPKHNFNAQLQEITEGTVVEGRLQEDVLQQKPGQ